MFEFDDFNLHDFFTLAEGNNNQNSSNPINNSDTNSLNDLLAQSFSTYLLPLKHLYLEEVEDDSKPQKGILTLSKFKELNMNKVKEDMLYYCSPVDILSKLDTNNSEYIFQESDIEFYNDISIKTFLQRQNELEDFIKNDDNKSSKIQKKKQLEFWKDNFKGSGNQTQQKNISKLVEANKIITHIHHTMKIFLKEKNANLLINSINEINSILKKEKFELENLGYEMYITIENNLIFLIGLMENSSDEELMKQLMPAFINMNNLLKSNRIFFKIIQLLDKHKNISDKIKIEKNRQIITDESIDIKKFISYGNKEKKINIINLKNFLCSKGYPISNKYNAEEYNFWVVNNREDLFIYSSNMPNEKTLFFYKINIREEEYMVPNSFEVLDFGKIILSEIDDDLIFDINISIKNDLIYVCYLGNQLNSKDEKLQFVFSLFYKIYSTSMILLKEGAIKLDNFGCLNSYLYSDRKNIYVISDKNKIFVLKKNISMNNYLYSNYTITSKIEDVSLNAYKYHNFFSLNNLIILENKDNKEELAVLKIDIKDKKYILNIIEMNGFQRERIDETNRKFKISYNDNTLVFTKIEENNLYSFKNDFDIQQAFKFLPFDNSSINYVYDEDSNNAYKDLLRDYSIFLNYYGNFDDLEEKSENLLLSYPYSLCFNININNFNFVLEKILTNDVDNETKLYYFIIIKQFICCLYNCDMLKSVQIDKLVEYMKKYILDINNNTKDDKNKKYINKIIKEIIFISSYLNDKIIIEIEDIKTLFKENEKLDYKTKLLLLDLLCNQSTTNQNIELFKFIIEFDKNYLLFIFSNEKNDEIKNKFFSSDYYLYKDVMNKTLVLIDNFFKDIRINTELFSLTKNISSNIENIINVYKDTMDSTLFSLPLFFISINFVIFYFILQRLIINEFINYNTDVLSSLYNTLITMDKLNINKKLEKSLDLNNIIEIKNSFLENEEYIKAINPINFNSKQNIIFRCNITDVINLKNFMEIILIRGNTEERLNLEEANDYVYHDVDGIKVSFGKLNERHYPFICNIIPVIDETEYLKNRNNENYKILSLFQKTILHYFFFLFEKIDEKINNFIKEQDIKNFCKLYHTDFLQFIYTNNIDIDMALFNTKKENDKKEEDKNVEKKEDEENPNGILYKSNQLIKEIYELFELEKNEMVKNNNFKLSLDMICDKFIELFGKNNLYKKDDLTLKKISSYKDIDLSDSSFIKLIDLFNSEISKKNKLLYSIKANDSINKMILKLFQIIVKYYNYNFKLYELMENVENSQSNPNYKIFLDIYEECYKMKMVYNEEKSRFVDEKFEEQSENYIKVTMAKIDFIYKIIISSFDESLKYDKAIINNLFDLIKNENFNPKEIIKYSDIQNLNCNVKLVELLIINNLLINLKDEENLKFILFIINNKYNKKDDNNNYSISMSLFDSIYGADFSQMEQVKSQFHILIDIIIDKYILNSSVYDKLTLPSKISLYQSLIWKYKGRDFNMLPKIINCFEDLKKCESIDQKDILFKINQEKIFRINIYNLNTFNNMKFEIFKIIASQIFIKIKENLNNGNFIENEVSLTLKRSISNITNYKSIVSEIISYFAFIKKNNKYYQEFILFFYKNIINSQKLIELLIDSYPEVITKIFDIIFDNNNINSKQNINIKLILLKLFLQILEQITNESKISCLMDCCIEYDKDRFNKINNNEEINPFEYFMTKFNGLLGKEENEYLKYYYFKIFLFCLNKIDIKKLEKDEANLLNINTILSSNNSIPKIESKFIIKNDYGDKFEENALFCSTIAHKTPKSGNLLCYIDKDSLFNNYLEDNEIKYFNYNDFIYNFEQKKNAENIFVIMDDSLDGKIDKINSVGKRNIQDVTLLDNKKTNMFYSNYLQKNSSYIYNSLINKLIENNLNYKGINYILKLIYNLLDYITIDNAETIIKYLLQYINDENVIKNEKEWDFCSLEYFINEMNSFQNIFDYSSFNILNENKNKEKNKEINNNFKDNKKANIEAPLLLSSLFNYIIENNDITIEYKSNKKIKKKFTNILNSERAKSNEDNNNILIKMSNLSFYKSHKVNSFTKIMDDSLLLINTLNQDKELLNFLNDNKSKIKSIIFEELNKESDKKEIDEFISKISIPIYSVNKSFYKNLIKFFIEGEGGEYIPSNNKDQIGIEAEIITIYKPLLFLDKYKKKFANSFINDKTNKDNMKVDNFYMEGNFGLDLIFGESENLEDLNDEQKNDKLLEYQNNIEQKYNEITFDLNKVYCLENIKLSYRILYELICREDIINEKKIINILNSNIDKILEIFNLLCNEYYFNISMKLLVNNLQNLLKKFLESLNKKNTFKKNWLQSFMKSPIKSEDKSDEIECKDLDKLLFIFRDCDNLLFDENALNIYFNIIRDIIEKSLVDINKKDDDNKENKMRIVEPIIKINNFIVKSNKNKIFKSEFISYFLCEIMNGIYKTLINNDLNSNNLIEYFIQNDFNISLIKFVDEIIEIRKYLKNESSVIPKSKTILVEFALKYLDICFYIFFKKKEYDIINYWLKSNNDLFLFYSSYKILSTEKHYEEKDYKEILSIIAYISNSIDCFNEFPIKKEKKEEKKLFKMKLNTFNKLNLKSNYDDNEEQNKITSFSFEDLKAKNSKNISYNKLAIFTYNKDTKKYTLQDIIDTSDSSDIKKSLKNYKQLFYNEEIYLVPLNNLCTSLYAFGNNFNHSLGINGKLAKYYDKPTKCEGLPDNVWNIGYGNNYCLALSDDDNQIYACGCHKGGGFNSTPRALFTKENRINNTDKEGKNKYLNFATGNCDASLLINEKDELLGIGNNEKKIFGLDAEKLKYPTKLKMEVYEKKKSDNENNEEEKDKIIEKIKIGKIRSFYIGYYNSYIINEDGLLFGLGNNSYNQISEEEIETYNQWKNIPLPKDCTKFVDCAVGENYIICLIEDINGNNKLYAQGKNDKNECGIITEHEGEEIQFLTMCNCVNNLSFKKIYTRNSQSAAITVDGDLYIWGETGFNKNGEIYNIPTLILLDSNNKSKKEIKSENKINIINEENPNKMNKIIVDDVAICRSHILIIARQFENGEYIRKLFSYGDNSKGALGLPMNDKDKTEIKLNDIKEIPLFDEKNEKLIPFKLAIGENKSYVLCVNEDKLIQEIKNSKIKDNEDYYINISCKYIDKAGKKLIDFYHSKNLEKFINLYRAITNKALSEFIDCIDEIKISLQENKVQNMLVEFSDFFNFIKKKESSRELHRIFVQSGSTNQNIDINEKKDLKSIFNYLNNKTKLITKEIFKYCNTNEKSEYKQFLQKAIGNNISYLSAEKRLEKFNELLSKRTQKRGTERRVEVDRFKANLFYDKFNEDPKKQIPDLEFNKTIFGQVYQSFGKTIGEDFFIQKGRRLFIVCLKNEYATDSGGPYHEVISGMCSELQSGYLNMFIKTPNNKHGIGLLRDKYIPNPQAIREINEKTYEFLGKLMASAITSGEVLDLNFHPAVWRALLGNEITFYDYENIDYTFFSLISNLEKELEKYEENKKKDENFEELYKLNFIIKNSNEDDIELKPNGDKIKVNYDNLKDYIYFSKKLRINEFIEQIEFIKKGFNSVIPSSIFQVLNWRQLEEMVCGKNKLDVKDFKKHTEYDGFSENDNIIKWFWEWLEECDDHQQSLYLKFVSGRTRLPKEKNFSYKHIIAKNDYNNNNESLPHSATCFFTLKLPSYKDKETLKKKLEYSILNCDEIDGDH